MTTGTCSTPDLGTHVLSACSSRVVRGNCWLYRLRYRLLDWRILSMTEPTNKSEMKVEILVDRWRLWRVVHGLHDPQKRGTPSSWSHYLVRLSPSRFASLIHCGAPSSILAAPITRASLAPCIILATSWFTFQYSQPW